MSKKFISSLLVSCAMVSCAMAQQPHYVLHNGSVMMVEELPQNSLQIVYVSPRPGMLAEGVQPGTILITGTWIGKNAFVGMANVFSGYCGQAFPYEVRGGIDTRRNLILQGYAPLITPWCTIGGYAETQNSILVFQLM